jgi:integrase
MGLDGAGRECRQNKVITGMKADAQQWAAAAERDRDMAHVAGVEMRALTVGQLLDDALADYRLGRKDAVWAEQHVRLHLRPAFGATIACRLTTEAVRKFKARRLKEGAKPATINRSLALLKHALRLGTQATPPKLQRVPHIEMLHEDNTRRGFFEEGHYDALLPELPAYLRPLLIAGYWTGCRRGELLRLRWDQVDLDRGVIRLAAAETKSKTARTIPMVPSLIAALAVQRAQHPDAEFVFVDESGQPIRQFNKQWDAACVRAGITGMLFHDLRRTAVRAMIRAGVSQHVAMQISGHKTASVFRRYDVVDEADLLEAAQKLQRHVDARRAAAEEADKTGTRLAPTVQ